MADPVIRVEGLGKRYHLGLARHDMLRDRLAHALRIPLNRLRGIVEPDPTEFWALRDVSFEVKRGEVLGIIGRNGAGKSTLLKILSRITEPTTGRVSIRGRVASLLEVGTGFHPELSGRENIFLNGAILGMTRAEIRRKFDEIVAFAEVEKFIDTPVKRYSSGMYVRLAFAVAAHLEPEILIIDEVLAVGDAQFQRKCLGKISDVVALTGRTVLLVSHNMDAVLRLCRKSLWLDGGALRQYGSSAEIASQYFSQRIYAQQADDLDARVRPDRVRQQIRLLAMRPFGEQAGGWVFPFGAKLGFTFRIRVVQTFRNVSLAFAVFNAAGLEVASARTSVAEDSGLGAGDYEIEVLLPDLRPATQRFTVNVGLASEFGEEDFVENAACFEVGANADSAREQVDTIRAALVPRVILTCKRLC